MAAQKKKYNYIHKIQKYTTDCWTAQNNQVKISLAACIIYNKIAPTSQKCDNSDGQCLSLPTACILVNTSPCTVPDCHWAGLMVNCPCCRPGTQKTKLSCPVDNADHWHSQNFFQKEAKFWVLGEVS